MWDRDQVGRLGCSTSFHYNWALYLTISSHHHLRSISLLFLRRCQQTIGPMTQWMWGHHCSVVHHPATDLVHAGHLTILEIVSFLRLLLLLLLLVPFDDDFVVMCRSLETAMRVMPAAQGKGKICCCPHQNLSTKDTAHCALANSNFLLLGEEEEEGKFLMRDPTRISYEKKSQQDFACVYASSTVLIVLLFSSLRIALSISLPLPLRRRRRRRRLADATWYSSSFKISESNCHRVSV